MPTVVPTVEPIVEPVVDTAIEPVVEPVVEPVEPTPYDAVATVRAMAVAAGCPLPDAFVVPAAFVAMVTAIRAIVPTVVRTDIGTANLRDVVARFTDAFDAAGFPAADPSHRNTSRFGGLGIMDGQNALYTAIAVSGVFVADDIVNAVWRAIAPFARCDYMGIGVAKRYPTSTLSAYMRGDHAHASPMIPGSVEIIRPWYVAGGITHPPKPTA